MTEWRYLTSDGASAASGLACDEALMLGYGRNSPPAAEATLRLYTYRPHCALVGRYQSLEDELDAGACERLGVEVGRRPTGGGAILMGPAQLGVALAARARAEESPREALARYARGVVAGLEALGIEARFRRKNDLEVGGRKIAGLGLYLDPAGAILFHASVLVGLDVDLMLSVLRIPGAKLSDKAVARVEERVTTVSRELGRALEAPDVRATFHDGFGRAFGVTLSAPAQPSEHEERRRVELEGERYGNPAWIHQRSPRRDARGTALLKTPAGLLRIFAGVHGEVIKSVLVTGDFNVLPAGVARLESALKWCRAEPESILRIAEETLGPDELGLPASELAAAIWQAAEQGMGRQQAAHPRREGSCYFPEEAGALPSIAPAGSRTEEV